MPIKIYEYTACSTCQKALRYLDRARVTYERLAIVEKPPSLTELKKMLKVVKAAGGSIKNLFNTSGVQYRELGVAKKLKDGLSETEALKLLAANGKLIKRPFLLTQKSGGVGFKEDEWDRLFNA